MCCCGQTLQQQHLSPSWAGGSSLWETRITDALETSRVALVALGPRAPAALAEFASPGQGAAVPCAGGALQAPPCIPKQGTTAAQRAGSSSTPFPPQLHTLGMPCCPPGAQGRAGKLLAPSPRKCQRLVLGARRRAVLSRSPARPNAGSQLCWAAFPAPSHPSKN